MVLYSDININDTLYLVDETRGIVTLKVLKKFDSSMLKVFGTDITFEVDYNKTMQDNTYLNFDYANAISVINIFKSVNDYIVDISEERMETYYDLDSLIIKYKNMFPELFI